MTETVQVPTVFALDTGAMLLLEEGDSSTDGKKARRFTMAAYTGSVFDVGFGPAVIDLESMRFEQSIPILRQHDALLFAGRSTSVGVANGCSLVIEGVLFDNDCGNEVAALSDQGAMWQASVGVGIDLDGMKFVAEGETLSLNGCDVDGPFIALSNVRLKESSFVPMGADPNTSAVALSDRVHSFDLTNGGATMPEPTENAALEAERQRVSEIRESFPDNAAFALEAITDGMSLEQAKAKHSEILAAELAAQREAHAAAQAEQAKAMAEEIEALKAELADAKKTSYASAVGANVGGEPVGSVDAVQEWESKLAAECDKLTKLGHNGASRSIKLSRAANVRCLATANLAQRDPDLHARYIGAFNAGKGRI